MLARVAALWLEMAVPVLAGMLVCLTMLPPHLRGWAPTRSGRNLLMKF